MEHFIRFPFLIIFKIIRDTEKIQSHTKEKIYICDDVTIGLVSGVVKNITESGVYGGVPVSKIK